MVGVVFMDMFIWRGIYLDFKEKLFLIFGYDFVGVVYKFGKGVKNFVVG